MMSEVQSPNQSVPSNLFQSCSFGGPVIQNINLGSGSANYIFKEYEADELEVIHRAIQLKQCVALGTGSWLYAPTSNSREAALFRGFRDDFNVDNATLLCPGYPAVGKTVLASVVKDHLANLRSSFQNQTISAVSAMYLGHNNLKHILYQDVRLHLLKNVARQCRGSGSHHPSFDAISETISQKMSPADDAVFRCFDTICETLHALYIVVDALDEYPWSQRQHLVQFLKGLQSRHGPKIKLFITFRYMEEIAETFKDCKSFNLHANDDDIAKFVDQQISDSELLHRWATKDPGLRLKIKSAVLQAAGKMFLLAYAHMKALREELTLGGLQQTIKKLPHLTASDFYRDEVKKIRNMGKQNSKVGLQILSWVFYSRQPMIKLKTLQYALALKRDATVPPTEEAFLDPKEIVRLSRNLVVVDELEKTVSGLHQTAYTYFSHVRWHDFPDAGDAIISRCAKHISFLRTEYLWYEKQFAEHVFTEFAIAEIRHQIQHVERHPTFRNHEGRAIVTIEGEPTLRNISSISYQCAEATSSTINLETIEREALSRKLYDQLMALMRDASVCAFYFIHSPDAKELYGTSQSDLFFFNDTETPLHFAALLGSRVLVEMLLPHAASIDSTNIHGDTALTIAMKRGFEGVVKILLQKGASFDLRSPSGWGVLLHAMTQDYKDIARQTFEKAVEEARKKPRSKKSNGIFLLKSAYDGHENGFTSAMLKCKRHPHLKELLSTAFLIAADQQHDNMMNKLLAYGVDIDSHDTTGNTALHRAARRNNAQMVKNLVRKNANVSFKNSSGHTPWQTICYLHTHREVSQLLIDNGADPNTSDDQGVSCLYTAAAAGYLDQMKSILEAGTDPGIRTIYGWQPLHWAAGNGHYAATKLLLEWDKYGKKVDINCLSDTAETPLDRAILQEHTAIIELLRDHGALTGKDVYGLPNESYSYLIDPYTFQEDQLSESDMESTNSEYGTSFWKKLHRISDRLSPSASLRNFSGSSRHPSDFDTESTHSECGTSFWKKLQRISNRLSPSASLRKFSVSSRQLSDFDTESTHSGYQ